MLDQTKVVIVAAIIAELRSLLSLYLAGAAKVTDRRPKTKMRGDAKGTSESLEAIRIRLLGGFEVSVGARTIEEGAWRLRKAANLVKLLALAAGNRLHREQVMYTLWPELGISAASNNLRQTVHSARRTFDLSMGSRYLASRDESLVLCPESSLWVDVDAFEEAARTARRSREPSVYRGALDLYTPGSYCRPTATRSGPRNLGAGCRRRISRYCWGSRTSMRSSRTMTPPSRR